MPFEKITFTVAEAVMASGLSRSTLYELMGSGRLPSIKLAGRRLIRKEELERLLCAQAS